MLAGVTDSTDRRGRNLTQDDSSKMSCRSCLPMPADTAGDCWPVLGHQIFVLWMRGRFNFVLAARKVLFLVRLNNLIHFVPSTFISDMKYIICSPAQQRPDDMC